MSWKCKKSGRVRSQDSVLGSVHSSHKRWVRIANPRAPADAGALAVARNGKPLPPLGVENQQASVTFTPDGVRR